MLQYTAPTPSQVQLDGILAQQILSNTESAVAAQKHDAPKKIYTHGVAIHVNKDDDGGAFLGADNTAISFVDSDMNSSRFIGEAAKQRERHLDDRITNYRAHLHQNGTPTYDPIGWSVMYEYPPRLKRAIASHKTTEVNGKKGSLFISDLRYFQKIAEEAAALGVSAEADDLYTRLHETTHGSKTLAKKLFSAIYSEFPYPEERRVEREVFEYASKMAEESTGTDKELWQEIAAMASSRYNNVVRNYKAAKRRWKGDVEEEPPEDSDPEDSDPEDSDPEDSDPGDSDSEDESPDDDSEESQDGEADSE